jgi:anaerobic selenocysteine-containing dehydrogenase
VAEGADVDAAYPFHLVPSPRLGLWDGRHANLPWLQEAPDQITKVVWDSWAELHPSAASRLGVQQGDILSVTSAHGTLNVKAVVTKSIHPEAIAIPLGQGHQEYGRYAQGLGVNPLKILSPVTDVKTGELAMYATRVQVAKVGTDALGIVRMGGSDSQAGRKLVITVPVDRVRRTEGA